MKFPTSIIFIMDYSGLFSQLIDESFKMCYCGSSLSSCVLMFCLTLPDFVFLFVVDYPPVCFLHLLSVRTFTVKGFQFKADTRHTREDNKQKVVTDGGQGNMKC